MAHITYIRKVAAALTVFMLIFAISPLAIHAQEVVEEVVSAPVVEAQPAAEEVTDKTADTQKTESVDGTTEVTVVNNTESSEEKTEEVVSDEAEVKTSDEVTEEVTTEEKAVETSEEKVTEAAPELNLVLPLTKRISFQFDVKVNNTYGGTATADGIKLHLKAGNGRERILDALCFTYRSTGEVVCDGDVDYDVEHTSLFDKTFTSGNNPRINDFEVTVANPEILPGYTLRQHGGCDTQDFVTAGIQYGNPYYGAGANNCTFEFDQNEPVDDGYYKLEIEPVLINNNEGTHDLSAFSIAIYPASFDGGPMYPLKVDGVLYDSIDTWYKITADQALTMDVEAKGTIVAPTHESAPDNQGYLISYGDDCHQIVDNVKHCTITFDDPVTEGTDGYENIRVHTQIINDGEATKGLADFTIGIIPVSLNEEDPASPLKVDGVINESAETRYEFNAAYAEQIADVEGKGFNVVTVYGNAEQNGNYDISYSTGCAAVVDDGQGIDCTITFNDPGSDGNGGGDDDQESTMFQTHEFHVDLQINNIEDGDTDLTPSDLRILLQSGNDGFREQGSDEPIYDMSFDANKVDWEEGDYVVTRKFGNYDTEDFSIDIEETSKQAAILQGYTFRTEGNCSGLENLFGPGLPHEFNNPDGVKPSPDQIGQYEPNVENCTLIFDEIEDGGNGGDGDLDYAPIVITPVLINDDGGTATLADFTVTLSGDDVLDNGYPAETPVTFTADQAENTNYDGRGPVSVQIVGVYPNYDISYENCSASIGDENNDDEYTKAFVGTVEQNGGLDCVITINDNDQEGGSGGNGSSGGSRSGSNRSGSISGGEVLGAFTSANGDIVSGTAGCVPYLTAYMAKGFKNDPAQVMKLQTFLNTYNNANIPVTGFFGVLTEQAVMNLQTKYSDYILGPWVDAGLMNPAAATGYVYKTTLAFINSVMCGGAQVAYPALI